ncbi:MAG: S1 RNA-binding domain-containing protein [Leptolyngbyaceae cyanobacterium MO_188.B28]|nr:S1 RNA-binding domain-containing protein [Leptolyngbyaceae cyanobacterium MO_188.B28]
MTFSAEDFAKALEQHDYQFQKGSVVQGKVFSHGAEGAYIDIGGKSAAFLPIVEASLKRDVDLAEVVPLDSERKFLIIRDQDANGQVLLSIRRLELKRLWKKLAEMQANNETLEVKINGVNKGGVTAFVEGLKGFIPRSHLIAAEDLEGLVGQTVLVTLLEVDPEKKRVILSQRTAVRAAAMSRLERGQLIEGTVANIRPFGAFVEFDGVTGLLHINQVSKNYVSSLPNVLSVGQSIKAVIINIDDIKHRISLSTKVLEKYPGEILQDLPGVMADVENRIKEIGKLLAESDF